MRTSRTSRPTWLVGLAAAALTLAVAPPAAPAQAAAAPARDFDLQAHRGGLGLTVESTLPAFAKALELAHRMADNPPVSTFAVLQALPRIAAARDEEGYLMESLMAAISSSSAEAQDRMSAFLDGRAGKVR